MKKKTKIKECEVQKDEAADKERQRNKKKVEE